LLQTNARPFATNKRPSIDEIIGKYKPYPVSGDAPFETALADGTICKLTAGNVVPVSHEALLFIGSMRDFERRGYLAKAPADFMATMTDDMLEEVHRIAPLASAWLATIKEPDNG
jgi:hypothetical protein